VGYDQGTQNNEYYVRSLLEFNIPQGVYGGATLQFFALRSTDTPAGRQSNIGLFPVTKPASGFGSPYGDEFADMGDGVMYASQQVTWQSTLNLQTYTVSLLGNAVADINTAAATGKAFAIGFAPLDPYVYSGATPASEKWGSLHSTSQGGARLVLTPVPEPSEWAMLVAGLAVVGFVARRRVRTGAAAV
jgi:hypothetical protein